MKKENCIFCKIANGEIPSVSLYEDEDFRVIFDISPASRGHVLILTKEHYEDLCELPEELAKGVLPLASRIARAMRIALGVSDFNVLQNNGEAAGQTVKHYHCHIIPRRGAENILMWEPGESSPEELENMCSSIRAELG